MFQARVALTWSRWARSKRRPSAAILAARAHRRPRPRRPGRARRRSPTPRGLQRPAARARARPGPPAAPAGRPGRRSRPRAVPCRDAGRRPRKSFGLSGRAMGSPGSVSHIPASRSAASGAVRAIGPTTPSGSNGSPGTRPGVVRRPTRPQKDAGFRYAGRQVGAVLANGIRPARRASWTAAPLLPPGVSRVSCGFLVGRTPG